MHFKREEGFGRRIGLGEGGWSNRQDSAGLILFQNGERVWEEDRVR